MAKSKSVFVCQECGAQRSRWEGRCSDCGAWNSNIEKKSVTQSKTKTWIEPQAQTISNLAGDNGVAHKNRLSTGIPELDRVLGGGLFPGSYILLGGDPGIGKSTLILQMASGVAKQDKNVLYVTAEESVQQTMSRAHRLGIKQKQVHVVSESQLENIANYVEQTKPQVLVVDSIQTIHSAEIDSAPGSVSQVRECAARLLHLAKNRELTVILIGHVTKDGSLAGPRVLEHMVDTVLAFEGDSHHDYRMLRAVKNRFGATHELGIFRMSSEGLAEVTNPSELLLAERREDHAGSAVFAALEGTRPLLCEVQALCHHTNMAMPRRTSIGVDLNRLHMLLAVLDQHIHVGLGQHDVYVNVVGGIRVNEPAVDLSLVAALLSSRYETPLPKGSVFFGEVGLTGEVRGVPFSTDRVREALKLGFKNLYLPAANKKMFSEKDFPKSSGVNWNWCSSVQDLKKFLQVGKSNAATRLVKPDQHQIEKSDLEFDD